MKNRRVEKRTPANNRQFHEIVADKNMALYLYKLQDEEIMVKCITCLAHLAPLAPLIEIFPQMGLALYNMKKGINLTIHFTQRRIHHN